MEQKANETKAREIAERILGYIPENIKEEENYYEVSSGFIKLHIFKYIEQQPNLENYTYFEIYDDKKRDFVDYYGPTITLDVCILGEIKEILKFNPENLEIIIFSYKDNNKEVCLELE